MTIVIMIICIWAVSAVTAWGLFFADIQGSFPALAARQYRKDLGECAFLGALCGLMGPIGILAAFYLTGFAQYGWRLK